jgi:hypothetical protein
MSLYGRVFAALYDRMLADAEDAGLRERRAALLRGARAGPRDRRGSRAGRTASGRHGGSSGTAAIPTATPPRCSSAPGCGPSRSPAAIAKAPPIVRPSIEGVAAAPESGAS